MNSMLPFPELLQAVNNSLTDSVTLPCLVIGRWRAYV